MSKIKEFYHDEICKGIKEMNDDLQNEINCNGNNLSNCCGADMTVDEISKERTKKT